jgi:hypothetical protein
MPPRPVTGIALHYSSCTLATFCILPTEMHVPNLYDSQNEQQLLPSTALNDRHLKRRFGVFAVRNRRSRYIVIIIVIIVII